MAEDLHTSKASHMSVPVTSGMEIHLRKDEVPYDCKVGEHYMIHIPMVVTSVTGDSKRFKQEGKVTAKPVDDEHEGDKKMPLDQLRKKIGTVKPGEEYTR